MTSLVVLSWSGNGNTIALIFDGNDADFRRCELFSVCLYVTRQLEI